MYDILLYVLIELRYLLKCCVKKKKQCSFENGLRGKSKSSTWNKWPRQEFL